MSIAGRGLACDQQCHDRSMALLLYVACFIVAVSEDHIVVDDDVIAVLMMILGMRSIQSIFSDVNSDDQWMTLLLITVSLSVVDCCYN